MPSHTWQTGRGVPKDGVRDLPDVISKTHLLMTMGMHSASAEAVTTPSQVELSRQSGYVVGGTSVSAPAMAGIMALVEQKNGAFKATQTMRSISWQHRRN